jgi:hypothetical protein
MPDAEVGARVGDWAIWGGEEVEDERGVLMRDWKKRLNND